MRRLFGRAHHEGWHVFTKTFDRLVVFAVPLVGLSHGRTRQVRCFGRWP